MSSFGTQILNKTSQPLNKIRRVAGKFTYFLAGLGVSYTFFYLHFLHYLKRSDEAFKNDIEEIKKMIERQNVIGTPIVADLLQKTIPHQELPKENIVVKPEEIIPLPTEQSIQTEQNVNLQQDKLNNNDKI